MKGFQTIMVVAALDDRDAATLEFAARFAAASQTQNVHIVHIAGALDLPPELFTADSELQAPAVEDIEQRLRDAAAPRLADLAPGTALSFVARQGSLVPEIVRLAARTSADLVCVGRSPGTDSDWFVDDPARILHKSPCSVLVVPAAAPADLRRILVPVDFSEHAREALDAAIELARAVPGASVTALHVYGVPMGYHKTGRGHDEFALEMRRLAERQWHAFSKDDSAKGVRIRFELSNSVVRSILSVADDSDAQLIVMSSHGRSAAAGVLLGQVAESVCARTTRPLLCIKRKGEVVNLLHGVLQLFEIESRD